MSDSAKYICIDYGAAGDTIFVFPNYVVHRHVAMAVAGGYTILSAGFIRKASTGDFICFGESESLGIPSRPSIDSTLANKMLGGEM